MKERQGQVLPWRRARWMPVLIALAWVVLPWLGAAPMGARDLGRIEGRLTDSVGRGVEGVSVALGAVATTSTDASGSFFIDDVPAGKHRLICTQEGNSRFEVEVVVRANAMTRIDREVAWSSEFAESITVVSASRRPEPIEEAAAAVTVLLSEEIEREAFHGQLPKLLEFTPGVELVQGGLYDFNLNVRGLNSGFNRRVLVLIDGRDTSVPYLDNQEWANVALPLYDLESIELIRGPSSALYGKNAVNGVLNITSKAPRDHQGGRFELGGGTLATRKIGGSYSTALGGEWYFRAHGGYQVSNDFTRSRNEEVEYEGAQLEPVPLARDDIEIALGSFRIDKHFELAGRQGSFLLEGGSANSQGAVFTGLGARVQITDARRPWGRLHVGLGDWNLKLVQTARQAPGIFFLPSAGEPELYSARTELEIHGRKEILNGKVRWTGGGAFAKTRVDSADENGIQTALIEKTREERWGFFSHIDVDLGQRAKAVAAIRLDGSNFFDTQISPKLGFVFDLGNHHNLYLTYNEAFQSPSITELFARVDFGPPQDLSDIERELDVLLGGAELGFEAVPFLGLGNPDLGIEEVRTTEIGYRGALSKKAFLTADLYHSEYKDFVSALLPQLGTSLGRIAPAFGPYQPPSGLSPEAANAVHESLRARLPPALLALLSNSFDGRPLFAAFSFTNVGSAEIDGLELALRYMIHRNLTFDLNCSLMDFSVEEEAPENPIFLNAPEAQLSAGLSYVGPKLNANFRYRWSDGFTWLAGILAGPVPSYSVADLTIGYRLPNNWSVGLDVANLFDNRHYEVFGGAILERRSLLHLSFTF